MIEQEMQLKLIELEKDIERQQKESEKQQSKMDTLQDKAAEVLMAAPPRGNTGYSVYFITVATFQRIPLFRKEPMAKLFVEVLFHYRDHKNYLRI